MIELAVSPVFSVECPACGRYESLQFGGKQIRTRCWYCGQEYEVNLEFEAHDERPVLSVKTRKVYGTESNTDIKT